MKIIGNNVAYYFKLYLERKLDPVKTAELMLYFSENPETERDLNISGSVFLQHSDISFPEKDILKRTFTDIGEINEQNFDEFCIASAEKLLLDSDEKRLYEYIAKHPQREKDAIIYKQLNIKPDPKVRFPGKSTLKKPVFFLTRRNILFFVTGIAASLALIIFIVKERPDKDIQERNYISQNAAPAITEETPLLPEEIPAEKYASTESVSAAAETPFRVSREATTEALSAEGNGRKNIIPLTSIRPVPAVRLEFQNNTNEIIISPDNSLYAQHIPSISPQQNDNQQERNLTRLIDFIRDMDIWETSLYAVKGFNMLTESELSVQKTTDTQGKMTGLVIDTESYKLLATSAK